MSTREENKEISSGKLENEIDNETSKKEFEGNNEEATQSAQWKVIVFISIYQNKADCDKKNQKDSQERDKDQKG